MEKISIIIPVYNVESYLPHCLDSVVNQTYKNLEIILIDDGSTDNSLAICKKYATYDNRIKVISKQNGGQSSARNLGMDAATGDFIGFIDSDDWIEPDMYKTLVDAIKEQNADMAVCETYIYNDKHKTKYPTGNSGNLFVYNDFNTYCENLFIPCQFEIRFEIWNKLFRKEVLRDIKFKEGQVYEEIYFMRRILERTKKIVCIGIPLYDYRQGRPGSTISSFKITRLSKVDEIDSYISFFAKTGQSELEQKYVNYAMNAILELFLLARKNNANNNDLNTLKRRYIQYYNYAQNKSFYLKVKYRIFSISPSIYALMSYCIAKIR